MEIPGADAREKLVKHPPQDNGKSAGSSDSIATLDLEPEQPAPAFELDPVTNTPDDAGRKFNYIELARKMYSPLGASEEFIKHVAAVRYFRDALASDRGATASEEHRDQALALLAGSVSEALHELVGQKGLQLQMNAAGAMAKSLRELAPEPFDAWVRDQMSSCAHLSAMTAKRSPFDPVAERAIQEGLASGLLAASGVLGVENQIRSFTAILRQTLEADLDIKTVDEQMMLDSALNDFILARQTACQAQNYIAPVPNEEHLEHGLRLLKLARTIDKDFCRALDMIRARSRRRTTKIQVEASAENGAQVAAQVTTAVGSAQVRVAI